METDVLLEVTAQLVTGQVIAEAEALSRNQFVYLFSDLAGQQRLQTLCTKTKKLVHVRIKIIYSATDSTPIYIIIP